MGKLQLAAGAGHFTNDLPGSDIVMVDWLIDRGDITSLVMLPDFHAARIHQLWCIALGGAQQPGHEGLQSLRFLIRNCLHHIVVIAHQDIEALVDTGRVLKLLMGMACREWRHGGIEGSGIAKPDVLVASGKGTGDASERAAMGPIGPRHDLLVAFFLGPQLACHVDLRPGNVTMHVNSARHHHHAGHIESAVWAAVVGGRGDHPSILDPEIHHLPIHSVAWIIDTTSFNFYQRGRHYSMAPRIVSKE